MMGLVRYLDIGQSRRFEDQPGDPGYLRLHQLEGNPHRFVLVHSENQQVQIVESVVDNWESGLSFHSDAMAEEKPEVMVKVAL